MEPTTPGTPTVRAAHARPAGLRRQRPADAAAIDAARLVRGEAGR